MQRVLVLGNAGAGKSTLARQLSALTGLPRIHLDAHFWQPGWRESPRDQWASRVTDLLKQDAWIMDGNYAGTLPARLQKADAVIVLEIPRLRCLYRVVRRSVAGRGVRRDDLADGCPEQLPDLAFLRWIWRFPTEELAPMLALLDRVERPIVVTRLQSVAQVEDFLASVSARRHHAPVLAKHSAT